MPVWANGESVMSAECTAYAIKMLHSNESGLTKVPVDLECQTGDFCIIDSPFGRDLAKITGVPKNPEDLALLPEWEFSRMAEESDLEQRDMNLEREQEALKICRDLVKTHRLAMNMVSAHYVLLDPRLLFYFTADNRVDFRALISDLIPHFKTRIELRQVGVRDESRFIGGLGVCGRPFCCNTVSDRLKPVSIKMAKVQNIPVSSSKISGACGRLLCCLNFEYEAYAEDSKLFPHPGSRVIDEGEKYTVCDVNILARRIQVVNREGVRRNISACRLGYDEVQRLWTVEECHGGCCGNRERETPLSTVATE